MSTGTWDENRIRQEIARLDSITGLDGVSLPITFGRARSYLGMFHGGDNPRFQFSWYYFNSPRYSDDTLIDTIRHEYAHMMVAQLYHEHGHGRRWKECCLIVGATPVRCFNDRINDVSLDIEKGKALLVDRIKEYHVNQKIIHPYFDEGIIREVFEDGEYSIATIDFPKEGIKQITLKWVDENCILIS